ncbi:hypothetical protein RUND412_010011 [Rhizina undulata]
MKFPPAAFTALACCSFFFSVQGQITPPDAGATQEPTTTGTSSSPTPFHDVSGLPTPEIDTKFLSSTPASTVASITTSVNHVGSDGGGSPTDAATPTADNIGSTNSTSLTSESSTTYHGTLATTPTSVVRSGGSNTGAVVGGVIGGAIILLIAIGAFFFLRRRFRNHTRGDALGVLEKSQALSPANSSPMVYSPSPQPQTLPPPQLQQSPSPTPLLPLQHVTYASTQAQTPEGQHLLQQQPPYEATQPPYEATQPPYEATQSSHIPQRSVTVSTTISSVGGLRDLREREVDDDGVSIRSPSPRPTPSPERQEERSVPRLPLYERPSGERAL